MRRILFVVQVVGLLLGFYVMCAALVAGLITLTVLEINVVGSGRLSVLLIVVTLAAIFVVARGVFVSTHVRARDIVGVEVTPAQQPALYARIRELAARVGTRPPRRIHLVPDVNAAVWENTRLLGIVPGRRRMMIGLPLLMALTPAQMDSVLAHELGHYGNRDTRLGGLVGRTRQGVLGALRAAGRRRKFELPGAVLFILLFRSYAKLVLKVTQEASRAQEYAADRVSAAIAGKTNAIAALSEVRVVDTAFDFYLDRYVGPGLELGLLPLAPELFGGFVGLLNEPARRKELDEMRSNPRKEQADPFDSHPPMPERVAALAALPDDGVPLDTSAVRAIAILAHPADVLAQVAARSLRKELPGKQAVSWDDLAQAAGLSRAEKRAQPLRDVVVRLSAGRPAHIATFMELVGAGRFYEILDALPHNEASRSTNATGRVAREHAKTELAGMLTGWLLADMVRSGRARWTHSWADIAGDLKAPPGLRADLDGAVGALVAVRPDPGPLRAFVSGVAVAHSAVTS
jgi:Zn-dependent protease with chaperone function